ncbi:hypothetical protein WAH83_23110, partial [Acinetobacter baumannii]
VSKVGVAIFVPFWVINIKRKACESITAIAKWVKLCRRMMTNLSETETIGGSRLTLLCSGHQDVSHLYSYAG